MKTNSHRGLRLVFSLFCAAVVGCQQKMATQPAPRVYAKNDLFANHQASRPLEPGVVARGQKPDSDPLVSGLSKKGREVKLGDNWCRFFVRMMEVAQSIEIVRQALDRYPTTQGEFRVPFKMNTKLPADEVYLETEAPRGAMGFYVVGDGDAEPFRARAKSSCFCNLSVTGPLCQGILIADIPAIVGSLDIVMGEIDR